MVSANTFASVAVKSTCAPARTQAIAIYFPRPRAAPVMMMRFPVNSMCKPRLVVGASSALGEPSHQSPHTAAALEDRLQRAQTLSVEAAHQGADLHFRRVSGLVRFREPNDIREVRFGADQMHGRSNIAKWQRTRLQKRIDDGVFYRIDFQQLLARHDPLEVNGANAADAVSLQFHHFDGRAPR